MKCLRFGILQIEFSKNSIFNFINDYRTFCFKLFEVFTKNTGVKSINQGDKKVFTFDFDGNEVKDTIEIQNCSVRITTNKSNVQTVSLENQCGECQDLKVTQDPSYFFIGFFGSDYGDLYAYKYDTNLKNWFLEGVISKSKDGQKNIYDETIYTEQKSIDNTATKITTSEEKIKTLKQKTLLYKEVPESSQSKMYLIAGDKVKLLDTKTDTSGQKWYYISYQGKKEIKAWIKDRGQVIPITIL